MWIRCAEQLGFRVERSYEVYASYDGRGTILIASDESLDADDNLAQMIFHELCHALVEGDKGETEVDWGLPSSAIGCYPWREHACLRTQAWLADRVGLRHFFAPTTEFRVSFWDTLSANPFLASSELGGYYERSNIAGRKAIWRALQPRWTPLCNALSLTAHIAQILKQQAVKDNTFSFHSDTKHSLWDSVTEAPTTHPAGHAEIASYHAGNTCASCAWSVLKRGYLQCQHAIRVRLEKDTTACTRYEPADHLACDTCGACCREAYQSVEVSKKEKINQLYPEWIEVYDTHRKLRRKGEHCIALLGRQVATDNNPYRCAVYDCRPVSCRDFQVGGSHCLEARRRVGLSL